MPSLAHTLYWLPSNQTHNLEFYLQQGYTAIDTAAAWGEPNRHWVGFENSGIQLYHQLLPVEPNLWLTEETRNSFPVPTIQDGWLRPTPLCFKTSVRGLKLRRENLVKWIIESINSGYFGIDEKEVIAALYQPHLLIRLGYNISKLAAQRNGVSSLEFQAAICAAGIGFSGVDLWICRHCYRRCRGELHHCDKHSQSKLVLDLSGAEKSQQYQRARASQRAMKNPKGRISLQKIPESEFDIELYEFELKTGSILWSLHGDIRTSWINQISQALNEAPIIKSKLPNSFFSLSHHSQLDALQNAVASREWVISRWPKLILIAEAWLGEEKGKPPGLSELNRSRLDTAKRLFSEAWSHNMIAAELGISKSHLSHLLRRGGFSLDNSE